MKRVHRPNFVGGATPTRAPIVGTLSSALGGGIPTTIGGVPSSASYADTLGMAPSTDTMHTSATQESVILELSRRLGEREAEVRNLQMRNTMNQSRQVSPRVNGNAAIGGDAYNALLAHYRQREEELRVASQLNGRLNSKVRELEQAVQAQSMGPTKEELQEELANMAGENESQRVTILEAKATIMKREETIVKLTEEKEDLTLEAEEAESAKKKQREEIASLRKSKSLADDQIKVLKKNEERMSDREKKCKELEKEMDGMKDQMKKDAHTIKSKNALLDMQRQEMDKQVHQIQTFETKFQAKDVDVPQIVARADEADRMWSKIVERERKFEAKQAMVGALRDENEALKAQKQDLQAEVDELKKGFELWKLKLGGDKVHMPWIMSNLRDTMQLKEKIIELEEIIKSGGYTVKSAEAEKEFKEREKEMTLKIGQLTQTLETLKGQANEKDFEVLVLIGKLEECLLDYGYDVEQRRPMDDMILSTASSDINQSLSLNTVDSEDPHAKSRCITVRDLKDFMDPRHYHVVRALADGCTSLKTDGLCNTAVDDEVDDDIEEEEDEASVEENGIADADQEDLVEEDEAEIPADIHMQKVLNIMTRGRGRVVSPPTSPFSAATAEYE